MALSRAEQRRVWLLAHRGIGSSQAAACLGLDPYTSKAQVYDEITAILNGHVPPEKPDPMGHRQRGVWLEPVGLGLYAEQFAPATLVTDQETINDPDNPELIATPDGHATFGPSSPYAPGELVEVKFPAPDNYETVIEYGLGPASRTTGWLVQGQHQLAVVREAPRLCYYICTGPVPWRQRAIRVERHGPFIDNTLRPGLLQFWQRHVVPRDRPTEADEGAEAGVRDSVPRVPGEVLVTRDERIVSLCRALTELEVVEAKATERRAAIEGQLKSLMAHHGADVLEVPGVRRFTWRWSRETHGYDWPGLTEYLQRASAFAIKYPEFVGAGQVEITMPAARSLDSFKTVPQKRARPFTVRRAK